MLAAGAAIMAGVKLPAIPTQPIRSIFDDIVISPNGDIRYVGTGQKYTVLEYHHWLMEEFGCAL